MIVIGMLNSKGGVGKTTLTAACAVRAAATHAVCVVDLDSQGSFSDWHARRGSPDYPALLVGEDRASEAVEALSLNAHYDYVLLDGPPGSLIVTEDAVRSSTLVVIPVRASGFDLMASQDCISVCQETGTPCLVVINGKTQYDAKLVEQARQVLASWKVPVADTVIAHRIQYVNAIATGKTGPEKDRRAAEEIDALWREIKAAALEAAKAKARASA
jgi:chromosome partitioning protein